MAKKKRKNKTLDRTAGAEDVDNIVGLFLIAFGQGVNPLHVHRSTVQQLRTSVSASVRTELKHSHWNRQWKADAATVLGWMAAVGRMAALIAMNDKRSIVTKSDFSEAYLAVQLNHDVAGLQAGKWCR
ncbi:MAG: hypothetical protein OEW19_04080 [Acidobacteriota bacterium]|nr:hypothetical protein [Acidobacteriota bacterium]